MQEIFNAYKKYFFMAGGILLFIFAGLIVHLNFNTTPEIKFIEQPEIINTPENDPESEHEQEIITPIAPKFWYVYVTGAVKNPGVYKLSEDSRVFNAIDLAGGFSSRADQNAINLAQILNDEAHIHVPNKGENLNNNLTQINNKNNKNNNNSSQQTTRIIYNGQNNFNSSNNKIDINHAPEEILINLKGIGPALAKRIIEYRNTHGNFKTVDELINVRGIGEAKLKNMRDQIIIK